MLPAMVRPSIVGATGPIGHLKGCGYERLVSIVGEEPWAIKLPLDRLQPLDRVRLLVEAVACGQRDSILYG